MNYRPCIKHGWTGHRECPDCRADAAERRAEELEQLLWYARDELEQWTPDESMVKPNEELSWEAYIRLRDRIDAALGATHERG